MDNTLRIYENIEDDTDPVLLLVTLKEASLSLEKLRHFSIQSEVGVKVYETLFTLEKNIEKLKLS